MQVAGAEVLVAETIRRLADRIEPVVCCLDQVGALGEIMAQEGCEVKAFDRRPGFDLRVIRRFAKVIRERRLQVLHAHQYTPFFYAALAAKLAGVKTRVLLTEHGRHYPDVVSRRRRIANRFLFNRLADRITAVCEFSAAGLSTQDGFPRERIEIIQNGIDLQRYEQPADKCQVKQRLGLAIDRRYVAAIARFHPVKDHQTLIRAFARVCSQIADVDLLLVGDGPQRADLERLVSDLGLGGRVRFLGVRLDVPEILRASDIFALSSLSEAASITLLEAMATGRPVVVTEVGGNPEIVRQNQEGLLVPRGDSEAMASAMSALLQDPGLARTMGQRGAERVRSNYRLDQTIERYYQIYHQLASGTS
jgi:N-acetyl-alpha-D-glucosaminyl L-malate synthase BshA